MLQKFQPSPVYETILGRKHCDPNSRNQPVVVELILPRPGEHAFQWKRLVDDETDAVIAEYHHYGFRFHPSGPVVNVQVFGEQSLIDRFSQSGALLRCELELEMKTVGERKFVYLNLYVTHPKRKVTHGFRINAKSPKALVGGEYSTNDMKGMTIGVFPL